MRTFLAFLLCLTTALGATSKHVRPGAAGTQTGDDWTNAYTNVPAVLVRDTVYYLADGTYPGDKRWNTANSGTTYIEFRKATEGDHGSATGWSSAFGDGQAVMTGFWEFSQDYYKINGVSRDSMTSGYKMKWDNATNPREVDVLSFGSNFFSQSSKHIHVAYVELEGTHSSDDTYDDRLLLIRSLTPVGDDDSDDIYVGYSYIHHAGAGLLMVVSATNLVVEYSRIEYNDSSAAAHSEGVIINSGCVNLDFHHNEVWDAEGTAFFATPTVGHPGCSGPPSTNWRIYGNVFGYTQANASRPLTAATDARRTGAGNGLLYLFDTDVGGFIDFYNNTIVNCDAASGWGSANMFIGNDGGNCGETFSVRNNLFWNCSRVDESAGITTWSHNTYFSCDTVNDNDPNKETGTTNPFVDSANDDYRIDTATAAGVTLASPYDVDPTGETRGADGTWDRGAFELGAPCSDLPDITSALEVIGTNGIAFTYQITVDCTATNYASGALPNGLTLSAVNGSITGTPDVASPPTTNVVSLCATNSFGGSCTNVTFIIRAAASAESGPGSKGRGQKGAGGRGRMK